MNVMAVSSPFEKPHCGDSFKRFILQTIAVLSFVRIHNVRQLESLRDLPSDRQRRLEECFAGVNSCGPVGCLDHAGLSKS